MEKHKGYQEYLRDVKHSGIKPIAKKVADKNDKFQKLYYRLTNISVKKLNQIPNIRMAKHILDIGCGTGELLEYVKRFINAQAEFYGVDLEKNPDLPDYINFQGCDLEEGLLPFGEGSFDLVISNFVVEHLKNPQKLFLESFRVLKPKGYFYLTTEYYTSIFYPDYWNFYSDPTHIRPWTKRSLKTLAKMSGFEVYKVGVIRWWEFLPLFPFIPILNLLTKSNFSFIPFEILGRTVYIIAKKP